MAAPASAREAAYQTLWGRIVTMELRPGDPLNDRQLAEEMGISRTPVREALIMLNIAHMVTIKPQSGTYVAPIDLKLMRMEQFARFTLEKEMLSHVCRHCRPEQIAAYRTNIKEHRAAADVQPDAGGELLGARAARQDRGRHRSRQHRGAGARPARAPDPL